MRRTSMSRVPALFALMCASTWAGVAPASASPAGYVYVAVPAPVCSATPCPGPQVLVLDGATALLVTAIDLPAQTSPRGLAMSPDGAHLYVSNLGVPWGAANSMSVVDARRHKLIATHPLGPNDWGRLAVRGDDSRVYLMLDSAQGATHSGLEAFDTSSHTIVAATTLSLRAVAVA